MPIQIIVEKCTGCTLCVKVCPFDAIRMMDKKAVIDLNKCTLCGACVPACKFKAVLLQKPEPTSELPTDLKDYKGIWVFIEQKNGKIQSVAYELLGKANELSRKLGCEVSGVLIAYNVEDQVDGAEVVVVTFGITSRTSIPAIEQARKEGMKVGHLRLVVVWPFPSRRREDAKCSKRRH